MARTGMGQRQDSSGSKFKGIKEMALAKIPRSINPTFRDGRKLCLRSGCEQALPSRSNCKREFCSKKCRIAHARSEGIIMTRAGDITHAKPKHVYTMP